MDTITHHFEKKEKLIEKKLSPAKNKQNRRLSVKNLRNYSNFDKLGKFSLLNERFFEKVRILSNFKT